MYVLKKQTYLNLIKENEDLKAEVEKLKDDSGEALLENLQRMAKKCNIDIHGEEYQVFMNRMFMDVAGRSSGAAKAYSKMAFVKDTPEEIMERAKKLQEQASVITKQQIEYEEEPAIEVPKKRVRKKK